MDYSGIPFVFHPAPKVPTPLALIGGVASTELPPPPKLSPFEVISSSFFDWYQCSLPNEPQDVIGAAENWFRKESNMCVQIRPTSPQRPYKTAVELYTEYPTHEVSFCTIHYGGVNERMMYRSTSDRASKGAQFIRECFPEHQASRVDVAMDFDEGPDWFSTMADWLIDHANNSNPKMTLDFRGDWSNGKKGRTLYVGTRKSAVYIRLYEKGVKELQEGNLSASPDWVRFEAEIKPEKKAGKLMLSKMTPVECFGCSAILRSFADMVCGAQVSPVKVTKVHRMKDHDRAFAHLAFQYGDILLDEIAQHSSAEEFVSKLVGLIQEQKDKRSRKKEKLSGRRENIVNPSNFSNPAVSVPRSVPETSQSLLTPAFLRKYPKLLRGQEYQPVSEADVLPLLLRP
jgi:hypothetical protein